MSHWHIKNAIQVIKQGGIISYPTESVFGLGCNPNDLEAVLQLLEIKQRDISKGLLLVADTIAQLEPFINISDSLTVNKLMANSSKPVTWIVPCNYLTPAWLTGKHQSIAVRISRHPIVKQLCAEFNAALVSTSANISGQASTKKAWQVRKRFANKVNYYVPGDLGVFVSESEIRNIITDEIVRAS